MNGLPVCCLLPWYSFVQSLYPKNKINATPILFLVSLSFIIVNFTTLPCLENTRYKSLLVRKGQVGYIRCAFIWGQSTTHVFRWGREGNQKSSSPRLSRGSVPTVPHPSQRPWHHKYWEGSGPQTSSWQQQCLFLALHIPL